MKNPSLLAHLRDILILPFTVTVIVPYFIRPSLATGYTIFKISGIIIGMCGLTLFLYTVFLFRILGKGTLAPWSPKQKLVINGPYRYCRNPMITGVLFILSGEALFFHSTDLLIWAGSFFALNIIHFAVFEEPDLEERFGEEYKRYKKNVPRWMPRMKPFQITNDPDSRRERLTSANDEFGKGF